MLSNGISRYFEANLESLLLRISSRDLSVCAICYVFFNYGCGGLQSIDLASSKGLGVGVGGGALY